MCARVDRWGLLRSALIRGRLIAAQRWWIGVTDVRPELGSLTGGLPEDYTPDFCNGANLQKLIRAGARQETLVTDRAARWAE